MSTGAWFRQPRPRQKAVTSQEITRMADLSDPDQAQRQCALRVIDQCRRVLSRMCLSLEHQGSVPTGRFLEALEWARLQLERARHVQL